MQDHKGLWQAVLGELEVSLSRANFSTWFKNTAILSSEDGHVVVAVPNIFTKQWLEKKYHADIKAALEKVHNEVHSVEYKVSSASPALATAGAAVGAVPGGRPAVRVRAEGSPRSYSSRLEGVQTALPTAAPDTNPNLNSRYTFDTFVVGSSNELAYAACQAVAKAPGTKYNPLFLYGGVGLGKTHLMQAVGNEIIRRDQTKRIEYVTSESFTNEFISSLSRKKNESFVDKYRQVDVLIIDDMQFLAGKEKTQDEFFHTFNALHQANKQIIISSDRPPQELTTLEERLRSRFAMGMIADVQAPDLETRAAIIEARAESEGMILPPGVSEFIAQHVKSNIRELEGAFTQLMAACEVKGMPLTLEAAQSVFGRSGAVSRARRASATPSLVLERVAAYYELQISDLIGPRRDKDIVVPRQIAMYLMRQELGLSFPKIAQAVGGRDHTTAMHSVTKIEKLSDKDETVRTDIAAIKQQLGV